MAFRMRPQTSACRPCSRSRAVVRVVAFKENQVVEDWRTQKMVDVAKVFYHQVLSKPQRHRQALEEVVDDSIVFRDNVWGTSIAGQAPVVGRTAFREHLNQLRQQYPDMQYEIEQLGVQDPHHLFVLWSCHETQLESPQGPASLHSSVFSGVDVLTFNKDWSRVVEVSQFRQPNHEERERYQPKEEASPYELKLARLHWNHHSDT